MPAEALSIGHVTLAAMLALTPAFTLRPVLSFITP